MGQPDTPDPSVGGSSFFASGWPSFDAALAGGEAVTIAMQLNGMTRETVVVAKDVDQAAVLATAMGAASIAKFAKGRQGRWCTSKGGCWVS